MFGLEDQKNKKPSEEFVFDLEKDLKDPAKRKEWQKIVEEKIQKVKEILRTGESQDDFDNFGLLLHGYTSLLKVIERIGKSK